MAEQTLSRESVRPATPAASPANRPGRAALSVSPLLSAGLATLALAAAFVAQGYLSRRVFLADALYLFIGAVALFAAASWRQDPSLRRGRLALVLRIALLLAALAVAAKVYLDLAQNRNFVQSVALAFVPPLLIGAVLGAARTVSRPDNEPDSYADLLHRRDKAAPAQQALDWLCVVLSAVLASIAMVYWFKPGKTNEAIVVNILSIVVLFIALYRADRGKATAAAAPGDAPTWPVEIAIVLVIIAAGAFLRFWQLQTIPYGVWFDEGETGLEALRIFNGMPYTPIGTYSTANPSLFFYMIAFLYKFMGPTLLAVRTVQAATGLLAVPALYALLRMTMGWRVAATGALLLAASAWHVDFSRFGMPYSIGAPLFEVLTLVFLFRGLRGGRLADFGWAGLMGGLGMHTYTGFRIFPAAVLFYALYGFILGKDRIRQSVGGLIIVAIVGLLTFAPLGTWALQHSKEFLSRTGQTSVCAGKNTAQECMAAVENSLRRHVQMLNFHGDGNGRHNLPGSPAVDYITGAALTIGLGYALLRWRSPFYLLLAAWFVVTMMAGVLSLDWEAPQMARTIVAVPAVCALAAIAIGKVWEAWDRVAGAIASPAGAAVVRVGAAALVAALLGAVFYLNYNKYFNGQMRNSEAFYSFSTIETTVARRVAELGPTANRYYLQNQGTPAFTFLAGGDTPQRPVDSVFYQPYAHMPLREPATKTAVYLLEPWRVTIEPADVLRYYPHAEFREIKDPFGKTMIYEFRVPADDVNNLLGLTGRYYAGDEPSGTPIMERVDKTINADWRSRPPVSGSFNVEWTGSIVPPQAGAYTLEVVADGPVRVQLDGQWLDLSQAKPNVQLDLARGLHPITIRFRGNSISLNWTVPGGQRQTIPSSSLIALGWPEHGLVGRYYRGDAWQGRPEYIQVDPYMAFRWHPDPIEGGGGWSAAWTGQLDIQTAGRYLFQGVTNDRLWLTIDGKAYMNGIRNMNEVQIELSAGRHEIEIKYANNKGYSELRMMWRKPDGTFEPLPYSALYVK